MSVWAPISPEAWAELKRPRTPRALAREIYAETFAHARQSGMDAAEAHRIASAEVRTVMTGPRTLAEKPHGVALSSATPRAHFTLGDFGDRIASISDNIPEGVPFHDPLYPSPVLSPDDSPSFDSIHEEEHAKFRDAERLYRERLESDVGHEEDVEAWFERRYERAEQLRQSHIIGNSLECGGTLAYRTDEYQLAFWNVCTCEIETLPNFRRICFIPHIAAQVRAQKLASLEFFLSCHRYCRFWTFTSGVRVPLFGLRSRIEYLHRRLSELNKELWRRYGCGLVFRSTELGTIETAETAGKARALRAAKAQHRRDVAQAKKEGRPSPVWTRAKSKVYEDKSGEIVRDEQTGERMFHPHAHCVWYSPRGKLPDEEWSEMLRFVWKFWGHMWDDGKVIGDAREAVKYVLKPGEVSSLPPRDICALENAVHGLRLVTPMGTLKKEIAARKARGYTLKRVQTHDGRIWAEVPDHNKHLDSSEADKALRAKKRKQDRLDYLDAKNVITDPRTGEVISRGLGHTGAPRKKSLSPMCRVVARMEAAASITPIKEPRVMVMFTRGAFDRSAVMNHDLVVGLWTAHIERFESARRGRIRFNKGTTTGETRTMDLLADTDERFAPNFSEVWEASIPAKYDGEDLVEAPEQLSFAN